MLVGVDIGGTFTDLITSEGGKLRIHKLLSSPSNPAEAMLVGLATLSPGGLAALKQVAHGSTVATNAILERKGARVAFITTAGFRDVLAIGRQNRPDLYALQPKLPAPLIPDEACFEVPERCNHRGDVLLPLDMAALDQVLDAVAALQVEAVAVSFLYSFVNPDHEQAVRDRILERGMLAEWQVVLSSDVLPEFREYERASTIALEAYVRPIMTRYIQALQQDLPRATGLRMMKSDGGVMAAERVQQQAVQTVLSGPAAGVMGAQHLARLAGYDRIITLDIGGTSTDVALCPGEIQFAPQSQIDGLPLRTRMLDLETVGAGGGSIARVDAGGALRVGPQSAGADPGPMVYGRGSNQLTVSDANAILGRLDPDHFLGGAMSLDLAAAMTGFAQLGQQLAMDPGSAARGVIDIANASIERALRRVSVARGHDPRDFVLVAFGGAGPLHACEVAERLEMQRVLIPPHPGVMCAFGLLVADIVLETSRAVMALADRNLIARLRAFQAELLAEARAALRKEGISDKKMGFQMTLDMRYFGQAHELSIPFEGDVVMAFHDKHRETYGHDMPTRAVEIVTIRLRALGPVDKPKLKADALGPADAARASLGEKDTPSGGRMALYAREKLRPGMRFSGQALVFQLDSTVYVPAGWSAELDGWHNLILTQITPS